MSSGTGTNNMAFQSKFSIKYDENKSQWDIVFGSHSGGGGVMIITK